jgi:hypothetical protein
MHPLIIMVLLLLLVVATGNPLICSIPTILINSKIVIIWGFRLSSHMYSCHFIMLMFEFANLDGGGDDECPNGLCEKPSANYKGGCSRDVSCEKACHKEGFPTGFCQPGFWTGACKCCYPCNG